MFKFIVFFSVVALTSSQSTDVSRCTNHAGDLPMNSYIQGCTTPPCSLPQLEDAVIQIVFKAPRMMPTMRTLATAYLNVGFLPVPIPYDLGENAVTCNFLSNTYCPVLQDEVVLYTLKIFIESFFPVGTSVNIEFRVVDDKNVSFLCIRTALQIAPPRETRAANSTISIDAL